MTDSQKTPLERLKYAARELEADDDEARFNKKLCRIVTPEKKVCPECGHVFKGNGWGCIDAHRRSKHKGVVPYQKAWPLLKSGQY